MSQKCAVLFLLAAAGCEEKATPTAAPQARSQAIVAAQPAAAPVPAIASASAPAAEPPKPHPLLCAGQLSKKGTDAPKAGVSHAGQGAPEKLPIGPGHWTWVNLWAAWCVPCREEIPRLKSWEAKTLSERTPLKVAFISLDDDGRQLETFLDGQPMTGLKWTYWLKDGHERLAWLKEVGMNDEPELPAHFLIDPAGKVRCRQQGAIDDTDFAELLNILRGTRG